MSASSRQNIARALLRNRPAAAHALYAPVAGWSKTAQDLAVSDGGLDRYLEQHYFIFVDCLALYLERGDPAFRDLYLGEMVVLLAKGSAADGVLEVNCKRDTLRAGAAQLLAAVAHDLSADERAALQAELADIERILTADTKVSLSVLMIGDCITRDIMSFLTAPCAEDGVRLEPVFLGSKSPAELRNAIGKLKDHAFDLVFFIPFSYEAAPDLARMLSLSFAAARPSQIRAAAQPALEQACRTLDLLADLFECPIIVHNTVNVRRHDGSAKERAKNVATSMARRAARRIVNDGLKRHVAARNAATFEHVFILDEMAFLARGATEDRLGRTLYDSDEQHPAELGVWIARDYRDIVSARAFLTKKKVLVCDLDNTLWDGVIGEGAVAPYLDKQRAILALKAKGVVLAVNSKNDPRNVHWTGCALSADDFVAAEINWQPKHLNMKRIEAALNLKAKDFVFIDDRADERAMSEQSQKGLAAFDPLDARTWRTFAWWARLLPPPDEDRTQFYKEREARQEFLEAGGVEDPTAMFDQLGLHVDVRRAGERDLPRVTELINRTNQFNMTGARVTLREVTAWHRSDAYRILLTNVRDKFGTMGTVSVAVTRELNGRLEVPVFVLSCRVFGYGIEDVILNAIKRRARTLGLPVAGMFKETAHNEPARKAYPSAGFIWDAAAEGGSGAWVLPAPPHAHSAPAPALPAIEDPRWLSVHSELL